MVGKAQRSILFSLLVCGALGSLQACETAKRFAPPGFIKYEDLEKDIPANPQITERIENRAKAQKAKYPNLSDSPNAIPEGIPELDRSDYIAFLTRQRDQNNTLSENDKASIMAEFSVDANGDVITPTSDEEDRDLALRAKTLQEILAQDRAVIAEELAHPLPEPEDISPAPKPIEPF